MLPPNPPASVPGTNDITLAQVTSTLTSMPDFGADLPERFSQGVRNLVEVRAQAGWPAEEQDQDFAAFVFVDRPREFVKLLAAAPITDPIAKGDALLGRLFFMNRDASNGCMISLPVDPNKLIDWLCDHNLGARPLIMVYRQTKMMTTRRDGVDGDTRTDPIRSVKPAASFAELEAFLHQFHTDHLTPTVCTKGVWQPKRAAQYVPGQQPEKTIQAAMATAINYWFRGVVRAEMEDTVSIGRIDVRLLTPGTDGGGLQYWAVLELKIIKSYSNAPVGSAAGKVSKTQNVDAIVKGIEQAWAFRANRAANGGLVEIFDMREDKSENLMLEAEVASAFKACSPSPTCTVRPLFGTADHARKAGYTGAL